MNLELLHQGSVKDIYRYSEDELLFRFSNRYSIFDWGQMPDEIPGKGVALAKMGKKFFEHFKKKGFKTHYKKSGENSEDFIVKSVSVPRGDIRIYQSRPTQILIPLEVIYRFGAPSGSSLLRKYKTEEEWIRAGFDRKYQEGEEFLSVKLDFTTKLERMDRVLTHEEAKNLAGMNESEWKSLLEITASIAQELKSVFRQSDLKLWDGKLEFAFDEERNILLVDSIGLDEIRLTYQEKTLSKELLRQFYLDSPWYQALVLAKSRSPLDFKNDCIENLKEIPKKLPIPVIQAMSEIYELTSALILNDDAASVRALQEKLANALFLLSRSK